MSRSTADLLATKVVVLLTAWLCAGVVVAPASGSSPRQHQAAKNHRPEGHAHRRKKAKRKRLLWGAWIGKQVTGEAPPWDMNAVSVLASLFGKEMSLVEFSSPFSDCRTVPCAFYRFPDEGMESIRSYGAIPFFSWGAESSPRATELDPAFTLSALIEGRYDGYIQQFAEEARNWGHPFFLRFNWEMNGTWFSWDEGVNGNAPGEYVAAWRHVHDIFSAVGATNATWVWCPYADPLRRFNKLKPLYPGNGYVDWTCMDGYNWGRNPINPKPWRSFDQIFQRTYATIVEKVAPRKPMLLAEFGTSPNGGHKAAWIRNMLSVIPKKYPRIRGLIYLDAYDRGIDWPIESSATAISKFARGISRPIFVGNSYGALATSPISPP